MDPLSSSFNPSSSSSTTTKTSSISSSKLKYWYGVGFVLFVVVGNLFVENTNVKQDASFAQQSFLTKGYAVLSSAFSPLSETDPIDNNNDDNEKEEESTTTSSFVFPNPTGECQQWFPPRNWSSPHRHERFPTVEERVCQLMTVWYDVHWKSSDPQDNNNNNNNSNKQPTWSSPLKFHYLPETDQTRWKRLYVYQPLPNDNNTINKTNDTINNTNNSIVLQNIIHPWHIFLVHLEEQEILRDLASTRRKKRHQFNEYDKRIELRRYMFSFALDMVPMMDTIANHTTANATPVVMKFGDVWLRDNPFPYPLFAKWRFSELNLDQNNPIVWRMESLRHMGMNHIVERSDVPWEQKTDRAIFRGRLTGFNRSEDLYAEEVLVKTNYSIHEACMRFQRCALAYHTYNSSLADVGITHGWKQLETFEGNKNFMKNSLDVAAMLRYKMIISVEGNDVASGLKWGLLSNSVILMAPPAKSTFVMEHLLEAWVHYVPLHEDMTNVEERVRWVLNHQDQAQLIAQRATTFMRDLIDYPQEEAAVMDLVAQRYVDLWANTHDGIVVG